MIPRNRTAVGMCHEMSAVAGLGVERRKINRPNAPTFRIDGEELRNVSTFVSEEFAGGKALGGRTGSPPPNCCD